MNQKIKKKDQRVRFAIDRSPEKKSRDTDYNPVTSVSPSESTNTRTMSTRLARHRRKHKAKTDAQLFIRIPALSVRKSETSDPSLAYRHLVDKLGSVEKRFKELQAHIDANEEEIRTRREKLNTLLMEIEMQDLEEWRMEQQARVLERCFGLMVEQRAAFMQRLL